MFDSWDFDVMTIKYKNNILTQTRKNLMTVVWIPFIIINIYGGLLVHHIWYKVRLIIYEKQVIE